MGGRLGYFPMLCPLRLLFEFPLLFIHETFRMSSDLFLTPRTFHWNHNYGLLFLLIQRLFFVEKIDGLRFFFSHAVLL